jgi:TolA-binding protein
VRIRRHVQRSGVRGVRQHLLRAGLFVAMAAAASTHAEPRNDWLAALREGEAALQDLQPEVARKRLEAFLRAADASIPAEDRERGVVLLVRALHDTNAFGDALDLLKLRGKWARGLEDNGGFTFLRALTFYRMDRFRDAFDAIVHFDERFPNTVYAARTQRLRAWCLLELGNEDDAIKAFADFDARFDRDENADENLLEWAKVLLAQGDDDAAYDVLLQLTKREAETPAVIEGKLWLGRLLRRKDQAASAAALLIEISNSDVASSEQRAEAWLSVGEMSVEGGNLQDACSALRQGLKLAREDALRGRLNRALGLALVQSGEMEEGVSVLKKVILDDPEAPEARTAQLRLAQALLDSGCAERAESEYQHYLETYDDPAGKARACFGRGWALMDLARYAEASTAFEKARGWFEDPEKKAECLFKMADAALENEQYRLAEERYSLFRAEHPGSEWVPNAEFLGAVCLARAGESAAAEKAYLAFADQHRSHALAAEALMNVVALYEKQEAMDRAVSVLDRIMEAYPDGPAFADALHRRAYIRYRQWRFREALEDFQQVIARFPGTDTAIHARYQCGMCHYWLGRDQEALAIYNEFVERHSESEWAPNALFWIAKYEYNNAQYADAERRLLAFVKQYPQHALADEALFRAGMAASQQKEYVRAIELFTRLAKEYPDSPRMPEARFAQGNALCEQARFAAAILLFEQVITSASESDLVPAAWGRKGDCQFTLGAEDPLRYEESMASYRVVAENSAASPDLVLQAEYKIGRSLEKLERTTEAFEQYYARVILKYFNDRSQGVWHNEASKFWFSRAARHAADIMEARKEWRRVVEILERILAAGVAPADEQEARERIERIRSEHWWLFY